MRYLVAHESYHAIQDRFMAEARADDAMSGLFDAIVREGSATA